MSKNKWLHYLALYRNSEDHVLTQVVKCQLLSVEAHVQSQGSLYGTWSGESDTGVISLSLQNTSVFPCQSSFDQCSNAPCASVIIRG